VPPGNYLDVGCGSGGALDGLAALGWRTFGTDISDAAVAETRRRGHRVWQGDLTELDIPQESMDVMNLSHVLEHVPSPRRALAVAHGILRRGGLLIIEVPNLGSVLTSVFREHSWSLDLPRHFYHFSGDTLSRLVTEVGFKVQSLRTRATPRYLLQSMALALSESDYGAEASQLLADAKLHQSLEAFCRHLQDIGQGNSLRLVAECVK
jgi:SAM-dependent methyltransferase